jgi:Ca2+-transporting ATPase
MKVQSVYFDNSGMANKNSECWLWFLKCMYLCNNAKLSNKTLVGDPTEIAIMDYVRLQNFDFGKEKRLEEIEFSSDRKMMSVICDCKNDKIMFTKGAVDRVLNLCTKIYDKGIEREINENDKKNILNINSNFAKKQQRVLAFAIKKNTNGKEENLTFVGLAGMIDPPKKGTKNAIEKCKKAGMKPVMITGDHKDTAFAIAQEIGLTNDIKSVITGAEIDKMTPS